MKTLMIVSLFLLTSLSLAQNSNGLKKGERAPQITSTDVDDKMFDLEKSLKDGPVVLVFYRGGWCPYCNLQLRTLQSKVVPELKKYNARLVAISVDRVEEAIKTKNKEKLDITLISDPMAEILKSYKATTQVPDELHKKYKSEYKIDIEAASGQKHHLIAVPAVYTIAQDGKIQFAYVNEDYKVRAQNEDILKSLASLKK